MNHAYKNVVSSIENFQQRGSGCVLDKLLKRDLHILEFNPLNVTSYIPLPDERQRKKAIINIQNKDEKCFLWLVIAGTCLIKEVNFHNPQRPKSYRGFENKFNLQRISFPMALSEIPKFERQNNLSISVYGYQNGKEESFIYPLKVSKEQNERRVNLLLNANDDTNTTVKSWTLQNLLDHSIQIITIKLIIVVSVYMDFRGVTHLKTYHNTEELRKK